MIQLLPKKKINNNGHIWPPGFFSYHALFNTFLGCVVPPTSGPSNQSWKYDLFIQQKIPWPVPSKGYHWRVQTFSNPLGFKTRKDLNIYGYVVYSCFSIFTGSPSRLQLLAPISSKEWIHGSSYRPFFGLGRLDLQGMFDICYDEFSGSQTSFYRKTTVTCTKLLSVFLYPFSRFSLYLVGAQPPPSCSLTLHLVGKMMANGHLLLICSSRSAQLR